MDPKARYFHFPWYKKYGVPLLMALIAGVLTSVACQSQRANEMDLLENGDRTMGTILSISRCNVEACPDEEYTVRYEFSIPGSVLKYDGSIDGGKIWRNRQAGEQIEIAYDPSDPERSHVVEAGARPIWAVILPSLIVATLAYIGTYALVKHDAKNPIIS